MENRHGQLPTPVAVYPASIPGCGFSLFDGRAGFRGSTASPYITVIVVSQFAVLRKVGLSPLLGIQGYTEGAFIHVHIYLFILFLLILKIIKMFLLLSQKLRS